MKIGCLACLFACALVIALPEASAAEPPRKRDAATKRCHAAQRRVERQKEVIAAIDGRIARTQSAREQCEDRTCERIDRVLKAHDARRAYQERQLHRYETDAATACAPPPG